MAINHNKYAIVDFETGGIGDFRQPLSIGIVILDPRRLEIVDNGLFYSLIRPYEDHEKYGLDPIDTKALQVNNLTIEELRLAPPPKNVWENVINFMKYHNPKGGEWDAPIFTGWNWPFDYQIVDRLANGNNNGRQILKDKLPTKKVLKEMGDLEKSQYLEKIELVKEPYKFGGQKIFRPAPKIDVMQTFFLATESAREPHRANLSAARARLAFSDEGAHNALVDCLWTAEIFVRFLRRERMVASETEFKTDGNSILGISEKISDFFQKTT